MSKPKHKFKRVERVIEAYFNEPREDYALVIKEIQDGGGLTSSEVLALKNRLPFIHSETIVRQAGLSEPGESSE